jgi:hypothetical protein
VQEKELEVSQPLEVDVKPVTSLSPGLLSNAKALPQLTVDVSSHHHEDVPIKEQPTAGMKRKLETEGDCHDQADAEWIVRN